ncbi:MAG: hypothetical protein Q9202_004560 [Teloschistes flavicans]
MSENNWTFSLPATCRADGSSLVMLVNEADFERMIDSYYNAKSNKSGSNESSGTQNLDRLFNHYRDIDGNKLEEADIIGVEGCIKYFADLGVALDEPVVLLILTELNAPTMGEVSRQGFMDYWRRSGVSACPKGEPNQRLVFATKLTYNFVHKKYSAAEIQSQKAQLPSLRTALATRQDSFKATYKHTFKLALVPSQRSISLETALDYWRLLLTAPSLAWNTPTTPWLDWFVEFLETKWKKGVSKDMWEQTGVFVLKCLEDEDMGWWSEDGAWPGVLDEFVGFVKEKRSTAMAGEEGKAGGGMEL